jgi:hypothetical protein
VSGPERKDWETGQWGYVWPTAAELQAMSPEEAQRKLDDALRNAAKLGHTQGTGGDSHEFCEACDGEGHRSVTCEHCNGTGYEPPKAPRCETCKGRQNVSGPGYYHRCPTCNGTGVHNPPSAKRQRRPK